MTERDVRRPCVFSLVMGLLMVWPTAGSSAAEPRDFAYRELEGTVEEFRSIRQWRHYYWRDDFTLIVRDEAGRRHRVISREPTPWTQYRLGTTYTGLEVDWERPPRVRVIGVQGIDRIPAEFYDLELDPESTVTAFIVRVVTEEGPRDYYVNNWFHRWGAEPDRKVLPHYANDDPHSTVYGFLGSNVAPFDEDGRRLIERFSPQYNGIVYHARVVPAENEVGHALRVLHLMGRNKETAEYTVFHGDESKLVRLDQRKPRFSDVTAQSGLHIAENTGVGGTNPHAVAVEDFDGDGLPDLIVPTFGAPHIRYFRNLGGLRFADVTKGSGLEAFEGAGTGAAVADFDRDGHLDVYITSLRGGASRLFKGKGDGTFVDVSRQANVLLEQPARSCAWSDIDGDGWTDLYVTSPQGPNRLFRNNRDGTFIEIARSAGVDLPDRHSLGCAFGDIDGDGLDDLFVTNYQSQPDALFKNLGDGRFREITAEAGLERRASSVGCVFADVFNRGRLDLYVTTDSWLSGINATEEQLIGQGHTVEPNVLYENDGSGRFTPVAAAALGHKALSHDAVLEDLNHDGQVEIYVGVDAVPTGNRFATHKGGNPLWTRPDGRTWQNVAVPWDVDHEANCVCVPAADFDNDGDLDLLPVNFYSNLVLYRNETNDRNWLRVKAAGTQSNPDGIGARVSLFTTEGAAKQRVGFRHIQSGSGYGRSSPLEAHFGLGATSAAGYRVEVYFPATRRLVVREKVPPGQRIIVKEE